jgi:hypothetical protein
MSRHLSRLVPIPHLFLAISAALVVTIGVIALAGAAAEQPIVTSAG